MALERKDRVKESTTTTGTGTVSLSASAPTGYRSFVAAITSGATVRYLIKNADSTEWEVGEGVFTDATPDTLTRVTVYSSSNAGALVSFSAGTKDVSLVFTVADSLDTSLTAKTTPVDADELGLIDSAALYVLKKLTILALKLAIYAGIKPAEGTMWNGKISVTDAAGITVALKTLAGNDPSASDPVYITLGGSIRTITAALSVAKADGTNWMNAGSAELATKEIDYFVYLGYNATDGVVIGFSRIPFARQYSDFSATTTNEKYCAISTITTAAATDYYNVIGRFAATLSATAAFTWSVPTFTAINLIQRPIYETRLLTWVPTWVGYSAVPTGTNQYRVLPGRMYLEMHHMDGFGTSNANTNTFTGPFAPAIGGANQRTMATGFGWNNSGPLAGFRLDWVAGTNLYSGFIDSAGNVWTTSGTKCINLTGMQIEI